VENEAQKLIQLDTDLIEKQDNYWAVITDCLFQRRIETVRALLSVHSKAKTEPFQKMDQVLRTMPIFEVRFTFFRTYTS